MNIMMLKKLIKKLLHQWNKSDKRTDMNSKFKRLLNLKIFNLEYQHQPLREKFHMRENWVQIRIKLVSELLLNNQRFSKIREEEDQAQKSSKVKLVEIWKLSIKLSIETMLIKFKHNTEFSITLKEFWKNTTEVQAKQVGID